MSKSRGTFITAESYLDKGLDPEWLRYYYATKLNGTMEDVDLNLEDFLMRVNSDLVGKYINIASRCAGFITRHFDGRLCDRICGPNGNSYLPLNDAWVDGCALMKKLQDAAAQIAGLYEKREYLKAAKAIMGLADDANQYVNDMKPWELVKQEEECVKNEAARGLHNRTQSVSSVDPISQACPAATRQQR